METYLLFVLGLILVCLGGDRLVDAAVVIADKLGIPKIVAGATIVSLGTTLPEILVSTTAAFEGAASIAVGNAIGSIICNTALIAGLTQTIRPMERIESSSVRWRANLFFIVLAAVEVCGFTLMSFPRWMGLSLLATFVVYVYLNIRCSTSEGGAKEQKSEYETNMPKQIFMLIICAVLLYFGAKLLVDNGILIARTQGVPERIIAVTFIALGTSLPELVTSVISLIKGFGDVGLGNIIGANILNLLLVIGIPASISLIPLERSTMSIDMPVAALVMAILIIPSLIRKKVSRI